MRFKLDFQFGSSLQISIQDAMLALGSCFAEEVGLKLRNDLFDITINPHGILFNPLSIANVLQVYAQNQDEKLIYEYNGRVVSLLHHGSFAASSTALLQNQLTDASYIGIKAFQRSNIIMFTWGSAWVYQWNETGQVVGNCHKLPSSLFTKRLLTVAEIVQAYTPILSKLLNEGKQVVFTISPVRYMRDGLHENNLSKSVLMIALHELQKLFASIHYFPAYEIVTDELRDYRFFKQDLVHPNELAISYVYEKFEANCLSEQTKSIIKEIRQYATMLNHTIHHEGTDDALIFKQKLEASKFTLQAKYPFLTNRL
jgi:hypothetical protein